MAEKKGRVLCVDDEPNIVRALQWLLQKEFDVKTANSGQDGLALVREHDFDVVISDQRMPVMTGVEFLREVRQARPRAMRILLTGYSDLQAILKSVNESEVFRFINKPWNISELPRIVEQAVTIAKTQPVAAPEPELTEDAPIVASGESVLLIDDNPEMHSMVEEVVGATVKIAHAVNLADAVGILNDTPVSVIVSETRVGSLDATRLIRLMKQKHPEIVSVVFTGESDADTVTTLINQGQIYRFVPKPVRPGYLKLIINSALVKHRQLAGNPSLSGRHVVEAPKAQLADTLISDVQRVAETVGSKRGDDSSFLSRVTSGFRRLFGA